MKPFLSIDAHIDIARINAENYATGGVIVGTTKADANIFKPNISRGLGVAAGVAALYCCSVVSATTIVVVYTPKDVSIAADSLGTFRDARGVETTKSVCKIYRMGNDFLGVAGLDNDPVTKFSVSEIVSDAIGTKRTFTAKISAAADALTPRLLEELRTMRKTRPKDFADMIDPKTGGVTIILAGFQDGAPSAIGQRFVVLLDSKGIVRVVPDKPRGCPSAECPDGAKHIFWLGSAGAIEKSTTRRQPIVNSADRARRLVQLEIDAHAPGVGPPIDVVRITAQGPYVQCKAGCPTQIVSNPPASAPPANTKKR